MVPHPAGAVVLVRFPFSDLSKTKLRPAVVLAHHCRYRRHPASAATARPHTSSWVSPVFQKVPGAPSMGMRSDAWRRLIAIYLAPEPSVIPANGRAKRPLFIEPSCKGP